MATCCGICHDERLCYSLPCRRDHIVCGDCINAKSNNLGKSLKCPYCGQVFGMIDIELLHSEGETPERQKCTSCLAARREADKAINYCINCVAGYCQECFECHERMFAGNRAHRTISFEKYRQCSDKMSTWMCGSHVDAEVLLVCSRCRSLGCTKCQVIQSDCPRGGKHEYEPLETKAKKAATNLTERSDTIMAIRIDYQDRKKAVLEQKMETYQTAIQTSRTELKQQYEQKAKQLRKEYQTKDEELEQSLRAKRKEVASQKKFLNNQGVFLQELQEGVAAILSSYHPARLVTLEEEILTEMDPVPIKDDQIEFRPPELVITEVSKENLLGTGIIYMGVEYIETIKPPSNQSCVTVCYQTADDEPIVHAGHCYNSLVGVATKGAGVDCVRTDADGTVIMLLCDKNAKHSTVAVYQPSLSPESKPINYENISRTLVQHSNYPHFIKVRDNIFQTVYEGHKISIFSTRGGQKRELRHNNMKTPKGICSNGSNAYIGCENSIWTFDLENPEATLRKFADCKRCGNIRGISYHNQLVYVKPYKGPQMLVFNLSGGNVAQFDLPNCPSNTVDMQIHPDGRLVIASYEGAFCYTMKSN